MTQFELFHPSDLPHRDIAAWSEMQRLTPAFGSPLLGPEFALAVGRARADARVAVWRDTKGAAIAFLAHHRRPSGFARPIGAPFSDHHALLTWGQPGFDGAEALQIAGLSAMRLSGLIDPHALFAKDIHQQVDSFRIELETRPETYLESLGVNRRKNFRRYSHQLERAFGPLRLVAPDASAASFERLLGWKRQQIQRTGVHDFLHPDWTRKLMRELFATDSGQFRGLMVSLYAGEVHVASQFGVRLGDWFHPWIGASDPDLRDYSPGLVHQWMAIEAMPSCELRTYDLGPGFDHWKSLFARTVTPVGRGLATAQGFAGYLAGMREGIWSLPGLKQAPIAGRLRSRLDQIATMELTTGGRVQGLARAIANYDRRTAARPGSDAA